MVQNTFRVFVSSTMADMEEERRAIAEAIEVLQQMSKVVAVRAECFVARSQSPQEVCLQQARECDVYVGVFKKRWGFVPDSDNARKLSATALEYEAALQAGKPRLILVFKDREGREPELDAFLKDIGGWADGILWREFISPDDLKFWVFSSLVFELKQLATTDDQRAALEAGVEDPRVRLQRLVIDRFRFLRFNWLPQLRVVLTDMPLESVYVHLQALKTIPETDIPEDREGLEFMPDIESKRMNGQCKAIAPIEILSLDTLPVKGRCSVLLGGPGSGKSTFLRHIALREARLGRLPLLVELHEYAARLEKEPSLDIRKFLLGSLGDWGITVNERVLHEWMSSGEFALLLDGLDEVPNRFTRQQVAERVMEFVRGMPREAAVAVTSRIVGYKVAPLYGEVDCYTVQELEEEDIRMFAKQWFLHVETRARGQTEDALKTAQMESQSLLNEIFDSPRILHLSRNPMMLTILLLIHKQGSRLPQNRVDLYQRCTEALVESIDASRFKPGEFAPPGGLDGLDIRDLLRPLAFTLQQRSQNLMVEGEVLDFISDELTNQFAMDSRTASHLANELLAYIRERTGLLVEHGHGYFGFIHMTFQEYFAGIELAETFDMEQTFRERILPILHSSRWREPILLAAGHLGWAGRQRAERFIRLIATAESSPYESLLGRDLRLALRCLADGVRVRKIVFDDVMDRTIKWLEANEWLGLRLLAGEEGLAGTPVATPLLTRVLSFANNKEANCRAAAAEVIGMFGERNGQIMDCLDKLMRDKDIHVCFESGSAFWNLANKTDIELINSMMADDHWNVRRVGVGALGDLGDHNDLPKIEAMLEKKSQGTFCADAVAFGKLVTYQDRPKIEMMLKDGNPRVRTAGVHALAKIGGHEDIEIWMDLLRDNDSEVSYTAGEFFIGRITSEDWGRIEDMLDDENDCVRSAGVNALRRIERPDSIEKAERTLKDGNPHVRLMALLAYWSLTKHGDLEKLIPMLKDKDEFVRRITAELISVSSSRSNMELAKSMLKSADPNIQVAGLQAVGSVGTRSDLEAVEAMLDSENDDVRYAAVEALEQILAYEPIGDDST